MNALLRSAWQRWQIITHVNADYVGRFITVFFYYTVLIPFALGAQLFADPLKLKRPAHWLDRKPDGKTLREAQDQF